MNYEIVLNNQDTECQLCGTELPRGEYVTIDKLTPQDGPFCDAVCWSKFYGLPEDETS